MVFFIIPELWSCDEWRSFWEKQRKKKTWIFAHLILMHFFFIQEISIDRLVIDKSRSVIDGKSSQKSHKLKKFEKNRCNFLLIFFIASIQCLIVKLKMWRMKGCSQYNRFTAKTIYYTHIVYGGPGIVLHLMCCETASPFRLFHCCLCIGWTNGCTQTITRLWAWRLCFGSPLKYTHTHTHI